MIQEFREELENLAGELHPEEGYEASLMKLYLFQTIFLKEKLLKNVLVLIF